MRLMWVTTSDTLETTSGKKRKIEKKKPTVKVNVREGGGEERRDVRSRNGGNGDTEGVGQ